MAEASRFEAGCLKLGAFNPCVGTWSMETDGGSCTRQLWAMTPIGSAWSESMQVGAELHAQAQREYYMDVEAKNAQMGAELGVCVMRMRFLEDSVQRLTGEKLGLEQLVDSLRSELERHRMLGAEQDALARGLWVPIRSEADASWDAAPVLLSDFERPITVGGIAAELGFKCGSQDVHRLGRFVRDAFLHEHDRVPVPMVYYDKTKAAKGLCCYTERDRALITAVILRHGER